MRMKMGTDKMEALNVVIAVNESKESMLACEWTCKELSRLPFTYFSINLTLLHVQQSIAFVGGPAYIVSSEVVDLLDLDAKKASKRVLEQALNICQYYNMRAETHVVIGEPKKKICEAVQQLGADLLVMGSHGHCAFIRAIKGSLSDYCSRNAACPVFVMTKEKSSF